MRVQKSARRKYSRDAFQRWTGLTEHYGFFERDMVTGGFNFGVHVPYGLRTKRMKALDVIRRYITCSATDSSSRSNRAFLGSSDAQTSEEHHQKYSRQKSERSDSPEDIHITKIARDPNEILGHNSSKVVAAVADDFANPQLPPIVCIGHKESHEHQRVSKQANRSLFISKRHSLPSQLAIDTSHVRGPFQSSSEDIQVPKTSKDVPSDPSFEICSPELTEPKPLAGAEHNTTPVSNTASACSDSDVTSNDGKSPHWLGLHPGLSRQQSYNDQPQNLCSQAPQWLQIRRQSSGENWFRVVEDELTRCGGSIEKVQVSEEEGKSLTGAQTNRPQNEPIYQAYNLTTHERSVPETTAETTDAIKPYPNLVELPDTSVSLSKRGFDKANSQLNSSCDSAFMCFQQAERHNDAGLSISTPEESQDLPPATQSVKPRSVPSPDPVPSGRRELQTSCVPAMVQTSEQALRVLIENVEKNTTAATNDLGGRVKETQEELANLRELVIEQRECIDLLTNTMIEQAQVVAAALSNGAEQREAGEMSPDTSNYSLPPAMPDGSLELGGLQPPPRLQLGNRWSKGLFKADASTQIADVE